MTTEEKKVIQKIESQMNEAGFESLFKEIDGLEVLRVLLDELGEKKNGTAIIEFCFLPFGENTEGLPKDLRLFQTYTTIVGDIAQDKEQAVLTALNQVNLNCVLGSFHIFAPEHQMYHKYISVVRGETAEEMFDIISPAVNWIAATVMDAYDELVSLCS
jgi:hypothetical protein